jgi:hypothetical protein
MTSPNWDALPLYSLEEVSTLVGKIEIAEAWWLKVCVAIDRG